jgi:16S rRNA U516 pseudouridylate synthase RsuA-like enzyme
VQEYWVTLPQDPTQQELQQLRAGTTIDGVHVVPKVVQILRRAASSSSDDEGAAAAAAAAGQRSSRHGSSSSSSKGGKREGSSSEEEGGVVKGVGGSREKLSIGGKGCVLRVDVSEGKKHEVRGAVAAKQYREAWVLKCNAGS